MTFVLGGLRGSGNFSLRSEPTRNEKDHALQALFPLPRGLRPARELLRKFRSLGLPPLLFPTLQGGGQDKRGGSQGAPRSSERGGESGVSLDIRPLRASAPVSLQPLRELGRGRLLGRSGLPLPAPLPRLLLPAHHSTLGDVVSRQRFRTTAPLLDPPVLPDPRIEEQGRIVELALGRTALMIVAVVLVLAPLTVCGRERRRRSSSWSLSSRERSRSLDRLRSRSRGDRSRSSDRYRSRRDRSRRERSRSNDHYQSRRQRARSPARWRARGHAISLVVFVTARSLMDDFLPPLTVRGQRRKDGEPDESSRRVWRR